MKNLVTILLLLCIPIFFSNCKKEIEPGTHFDIFPTETDLVSNYVFKGRVVVNAHRYDNLIIENCSFEGSNFAGLYLYNVKNVTIRNCTFKDIKGHGIQIGSELGIADKITIENCKIQVTEKNGILISKWGTNVNIVNCEITQTASKPGDSNGYYHAINAQGRNYMIAGNKISGVGHSNGDVLHLETNGWVTGNTIFEAGHSGIAYETNLPANDSLVVIENNFIYDNPNYSIVIRKTGEDDYVARGFVVRFNTVVHSSNNALIVVPDNVGNCALKITHNILINPLLANYYSLNVPADIQNNLTSQNDIGFVNYRNRDLHIRIDSQANGFSKGYTDYPDGDVDGERRPQIDLDAGADEVK